MVSFGALAVALQQASEAHGGAEFQGFRLLVAGDGEGPPQPGFRLRPRRL